MEHSLSFLYVRLFGCNDSYMGLGLVKRVSKRPSLGTHIMPSLLVRSLLQFGGMELLYYH